MQADQNAGTGKVITLSGRKRAQARRVEKIREASRQNLTMGPVAAAVLAAPFEFQASQLVELEARAAASRLPLPARFADRMAVLRSELETLAAEIECASAGEVA